MSQNQNGISSGFSVDFSVDFFYWIRNQTTDWYRKGVGSKVTSPAKSNSSWGRPARASAAWRTLRSAGTPRRPGCRSARWRASTSPAGLATSKNISAAQGKRTGVDGRGNNVIIRFFLSELESWLMTWVIHGPHREEHIWWMIIGASNVIWLTWQRMHRRSAIESSLFCGP